MDKNTLLANLKGGLIVSCQALANDPLHSSYIMSKMALAAKMGGAVGIRANSYEDIIAIKNEVDIPVIGIVKRDYPDSEVFITPTIQEVNEIVRAGADIIAVDATNRVRPNNQSLADFYSEVRECYPNIVVMGDISTLEEGISAANLGFDLVATTLSGYTNYTKSEQLPNIKLLKKLIEQVEPPVIAEGGYWTIEEIQSSMSLGAHSCIVGTAITRPMEITKRIVKSLTNFNTQRGESKI